MSDRRPHEDEIDRIIAQAKVLSVIAPLIGIGLVGLLVLLIWP